MNKLFDSNLVLNEEEHKYTLKTKPNLEFTSVTTLIHKFFQPFDAEKTAVYLVSKVQKYKDKTAEELLADWKQSGRDGNEVHKQLETYLNNQSQPKHPKARQGVKWLEDNEYGNGDFKFYSEVTLYSEEIKIAGTIDLLIYNTATDEYALGDWKTSKVIRKLGYKNAMGTGPAKELEDCNYIHYSLQLSMYRYILKEYYDLEVKNQKLIHLKDNTTKSYSTPYYEEIIKEMTQKGWLAKENTQLELAFNNGK